MNGRSRRRFLGTLGTLAAPFAQPLIARGADAYTLRVSLSAAPGTVNALAASRFAAVANRRSNGQLNVEVYPSGQLISQEGTLDALSSGIIDFTITATSFFVQFAPQFQVFDAPFVFKDSSAAARVVDGPIGREFFSMLDSHRLVGMGWIPSGFREIETIGKPVLVPDDLKGQRLRSPVGSLYAPTLQALGAIPVVIDSSEIYTALAQHTVDGIAELLATVVVNKFYLLAKHVALSNHMLSMQLIVGSQRKIAVLPPALQRILKEEGAASALYMRSLVAQQGAAATQLLKENGCVFTEVQYPLFRKAVEPVYALLQSKIGGDMLERVRRATS